MKIEEKPIGLWGVAALTTFLLLIFLFGIPYLLKDFDAYLPQISLGAFKYLGVIILLIVAPFCLSYTGGGGISPISPVGWGPSKTCDNGPIQLCEEPPATWLLPDALRHNSLSRIYQRLDLYACDADTQSPQCCIG